MLSALQTTTKSPGAAANSGVGYPPNASWINASNVLADDGSSASIGFFEGAQNGDNLGIDDFGFDIPANAVIDGVAVNIDGFNAGSYGSVYLGVSGATPKDVGSLNTTYGDATDLWGLTTITPADINDADFGISIVVSDVSGGDGVASVDYVEITVYWRYDLTVDPADVPTRQLYKVYTNNNEYLGTLPKVITPLAFTHNMNSVGSQLQIECAVSFDTAGLANDYILTEDGDILTDESDEPLLTEGAVPIFALGDSDTTGQLLRNGNRVVAYEYGYYFPNGKLMFSGQINEIKLALAANLVKLKVLHDGMDLENYTARGAPFSYTTDVLQSVGGIETTVSQEAGMWERYGQTFTTGPSVTNIGAIKFFIRGQGTITVSVYENIGGELVGSSTALVGVSSGGLALATMAFANPLNVSSNTSYFFTIAVKSGESISIFYTDTNPYSGGALYYSSYGGGGGGNYLPVTGGDMLFTTLSAELTTTATYLNKDPTTEILAPILGDYNERGGRIIEGDFDATGLSLDYTFNTNTILDAIKATLRMSPSGFYYTVDLGTNELDFKTTSTVADFTLIKGRHITEELEFVMSIENVKNQQLFSGGDIGGGVNLFRTFNDLESAALYGNRLSIKSDNRVTVDSTATAMGESFIEEFSSEQYYTTVTVSAKTMDITLLTPGKVVQLAGNGTVIDSLLLQIISRAYTSEEVVLLIGTMPPRFTPLVEEIRSGLVAQETVANPVAPS